MLREKTDKFLRKAMTVAGESQCWALKPGLVNIDSVTRAPWQNI